MKALAPTDLAFFDTAPLRITASARIDASPERVFAAFADPVGWTRWFPRMYAAAWTTPTIAAVGAERLVKLSLYGHFLEKMIAWAPGQRLAFTMIATTSPLARRLAEDYQLVDNGDGTTTLNWVFASEPNLLGKLATPVLTRLMQRMFRDAGAGLNRYLAL